ncbi:hypothetical protein Tco_0280527 [Tanacetum coccineum]
MLITLFPKLPEFESFHFDLDPSFPRPPSEPPDVEIFLHFEPDAPVIDNFNELNDDQRGEPVAFHRDGTFMCFNVYPNINESPIEIFSSILLFDLKTAGDHRKLQLNELNELRDQAYENSLIYKEKTKKLHDSKIKNRIFNVGDQVLLFNSRLKIFFGKLKSRWSGPFTITEVYPYGTAKLSHPDGSNFKVNCHRLKHYYGGDTPPLVIPDLQNFPKDK